MYIIRFPFFFCFNCNTGAVFMYGDQARRERSEREIHGALFNKILGTCIQLFHTNYTKINCTIAKTLEPFQQKQDNKKIIFTNSITFARDMNFVCISFPLQHQKMFGQHFARFLHLSCMFRVTETKMKSTYLWLQIISYGVQLNLCKMYSSMKGGKLFMEKDYIVLMPLLKFSL